MAIVLNTNTDAEGTFLPGEVMAGSCDNYSQAKINICSFATSVRPFHDSQSSPIWLFHSVGNFMTQFTCGMDVPQ